MTDDKKFDEFLTPNTKLVLTPDTIETLKAQGKITERFITFEEHLNKLFSQILESRPQADELIHLLPRLDKDIANATLSALFEDLEKAFVFGMHVPAINHATTLLELACKFRLWDEKRKVNANAGWTNIEDMDLRQTILELHQCGAITDEERDELKWINKEIRNAYTHHKILELIKREGMMLSQLPSMNAATGEVKVETDVDPTQHPFLWFMVKRVLDRDTFIPHVQECMFWVNRVMTVSPASFEAEEHRPDQAG